MESTGIESLHSPWRIIEFQPAQDKERDNSHVKLSVCLSVSEVQTREKLKQNTATTN
jgi:hypothetical protein